MRGGRGGGPSRREVRDGVRQQPLDRLAASLFKEAARAQRCCRHPECKDPLSPNWAAHHVIYWQELRRLWLPRWDTRGALRLCERCHVLHHRAVSPVPIAALLDDNIDYAFVAMGERGFDYLTRHYAGEDPRLERKLAEFAA